MTTSTVPYPNIGALIALHAELREFDDFASFELCGSRQKRWEAKVWTMRKVDMEAIPPLAFAEGATPEEAAGLALQSVVAKPDWLVRFLAGAHQVQDSFPGIEELFERHAHLASTPEVPNAFVEIGYTRRTSWMGWLCSDYLTFNPSRKVLAHDGGDSADEAAHATAVIAAALGGAYA